MINNFSKSDINYLTKTYNEVKKLTFRFNETKEDFSRDIRTINEFQRDYARCIYSSSFRRLQGKMQLLSVKVSKFYRNRLTHSIEVATIAREIGRTLHTIDPNLYSEDDLYVLELASLMHDSGNPPFGHYGEIILNSLLKNNGGFEGNAQVIRIINKLEKKHPLFPGLDLTLRSQLSLVKYYKRGYKYQKLRPKKYLYNDDFTQISTILKKLNIRPRTIDVQIMDLSDEIAYAAHDLEDALREKIITIDEILYEFKKWNDQKSYIELEKIVKETEEFAFKSKKYDSSEEYNFIFRKTLTSRIVNTLINDIGLINLSSKNKEKTGSGHTKELGFKKFEKLSEGLKKITFKCISNIDEVYIYEKKGEVIIKSLFELYSDSSKNKDLKLLPPEFRNLKSKERSIVDYISGMMDNFAFDQYQKYFNSTEKIKIF
ncbi:deoxyguanosinetriphosphate triphosphohydrolase family protein [Leptospira terpstrae]|uniref:deoxyguanosinetriphosphate triphosphohydrolase family protein n=1 Tax=Leptospira terpstrae TaxID=293075 RepID=UPI0006871CF9|nr:dNTP triphosphohydrolase [Leptospira terpstrae]